MNHIYKSIFNKALGVFVAVPEFAASHSKSTQSSSDAVGNTIGGALKTAITTLTLMIWATLVPNQAVAGPGIYINDSNDPSCVAVADSSYYNNSSFFLLAGGSVKHGSSPSSSVAPAPGSYFNFNGGSKNPCLSDGVNGATSKDTQTNRTLFYGSGNSGIDGNDTNNGAQN